MGSHPAIEELIRTIVAARRRLREKAKPGGTRAATEPEPPEPSDNADGKRNE